MPRWPLQSAEEIATDYVPLAERALWGVGAFLLVYLIGRLVVVRGIVRLVAARNSRNPTLVEAVERYTHLLVVIAALAAASAAAGFGYLLTGSAIVVAALTLAIGVAGQEVIGDLVSGLFLVVDPEFNVGDWIVWEDGEGVVETIRFRVTRVRALDNEVITVPNTTLATTAVSRPYSRRRARIAVDLGLSYDDDLDAAVDLLRETAADTERVLGEPKPAVTVMELGNDAVHLRTTLWIGDPSPRSVIDVRSAYARRAKARLQDAGFTVSPPAEHDLSGRLTVDADETSG